MTLLQAVFLFLSMMITFLFLLYGFNHYYLLGKSRLYRLPELPALPDVRPSVSVQLPIYNEKYVVGRLMKACTLMVEAYGIDRASVLILDDSDDDTPQEIDAAIETYKQRGFQIEVLHRQNRCGFKAGALQAALERTREEYIAIFDADFLPPRDFLLRTVPYFAQDEHLAIVQSRWGFINRDFNFLTRGMAIMADIHFIIEQPGRYAAGLYQNFNGSGGVLRKKAILAAGGWQADTLAEDLDLSYRMQLKGYRVLYLTDLQSPGEIPPTIPNYKQQQSRWACGSLQVAKKILPLFLWRPEIKFRKRLEGLIHLTGYFIHPLMTFSFVVACVSTFLNLGTINLTGALHIILAPGHRSSLSPFGALSIQNLTWALLVLVIFLCTIAPWVSALTALRIQKLSVFSNLPSLAALFLLGFGTSLNNTIGAGRGLLSDRQWEWTRTPKYAELQEKTSWRQKNYQIASNKIWLLELAFSGMGIVASAFAVRVQNYSVLFILIPFTVAYALVAILTVVQS